MKTSDYRRFRTQEIIRAEKVMAQGFTGDEFKKQFGNWVRFLDIAPGANSSDMVIMENEGPLPKGLAFHVDPDCSADEIYAFLSGIMEMFLKLNPERFKEHGDLNKTGGLATGLIYYRYRDLEYIKPTLDVLPALERIWWEN